MEGVFLFPFADYWSFYVGFTLFVLALLALDLGVFHREAHEVSFKESLTWSIVWISLALVFNFIFYKYAGWKFETDERLLAIPGFDPQSAAKQVGLEFLTGFIVEKTLAVDNIFVFVVVFSFFAIPLKYQHRVLFFGIIGALIFRIIFIAMSSMLLQYHWVVIFFGVFLIITGFKIIFAPEKPMDPEKNPVIKLFRKIFPVTPKIEGQKFFIRKDGVLYATPLMIALLFIEVSDIIFAVDSVPAIFAITKEPLIVFTSNVFAILGLRALFFMLAGVVNKFKYLKYGLGVVLVFVGLKMAWLNNAFGGKFPISWSLIIILSIITISIVYSLIKTKKE
ncbi:MAG: tellurite resistance protein TerC [Ignavibacteria bacterium]|nr:MAG: tellurite resistance protein TerC [Ignavibacteria bacterium]KAF0161615.1 MAG: tellurite resistance protein TerC [Ignavibacteria bacterium]